MRRFGFHAIACAGLLIAGTAWAGDFELISSAESSHEQQAIAQGLTAEAAPKRRFRAVSPAIKVIAPKLDSGGPLKSPIRIELQFETVGEAKIDPSSFKVLYGFFKVDLTKKIRENASISSKGLIAENARVPAGEHKLVVQIADEQGRIAETELKFKVE